jgi:predicted Rossmann fold nucleotide-binding protein DprA/Smf involved in DNA uptake
MVLKPEDILIEYNITNKKKSKNETVFNDDIEKNIYDLLLNSPLNIDEIVFITNIQTSEILLKISMMEL